ncbi:FMN-binding negative transcriptional regulator [Acidocella sp.]|uniref:FMN-binding negative transcriptional regulator n=1 Tax=Acidocella sp. TaxID=50710 RepID=UPI0026223256|nr:FMN-binding negative transcriptional regulator [Acidocella sp.]
MYVPPAFAIDETEARALMAAVGFCTLVSRSKAGGLMATHMPMLQDGNRLIGHVAKNNPHGHEASDLCESLAIFTGPEGYVSPSFYATKQETGKVVPTWNYRAVHVHGKLEIVSERAALRAIVERLTEHFEARRPAPWKVSDAPADYVEALLNGITGVVLHIERMEGAAKLSQNKTMADREGVAAGFAADNPALSAAIRETF